MKHAILNRFLTYVKSDTQSSEDTHTTPSTSTQGYFAEMLADELSNIGLEDVHVSRYSYVTATIPANVEGVPTIGFISHMDTSPEVSGKNVNPQIIEYKGNNLVTESDFVISLKDNPELKNYEGNTIITSDGETLLGADDKAGIAEIISAAEYLMSHPEIKHGKIRLAFTPDEEIGEGADHFNVEKFGADFAYTMDGGALGEIEYENFNAAAANIFFEGVNIHPGYAKDRMINAIVLANQFISTLIANGETPDNSEGYEGFFHITSFNGSVEKAEIHLIIRDFDANKFQQRKAAIEMIVRAMSDEYEGTSARIWASINDQYLNMRSKIEEHPEVVKLAIDSMEELGIVPKVVPIRGGTDGARLSFMGLPCPNIFAGGHNFHSRSEYVPLESMEKATELIITICKNAAKMK